MKWEIGMFSIALTTLTGWLGGWDLPLKLYVAFMIADYATGLLAAVKNKKVNSDVIFWGGIRKGATLVIIAFGVGLDALVNDGNPVFRTLFVFYYLSREGISVLENFGLLGVNYPTQLKDILEQLKKDKGDDSNGNKTDDNSVS